MCVFPHNTSHFLGVVYLIIRIRHFFAGLASDDPFWIHADLLNWTTEETLKQKWLDVSLFWSWTLAWLHFSACVRETTMLYVLKSTVEFRTSHILFGDTCSSWRITFWILNSELIVHKCSNAGWHVYDRSLVWSGSPSIWHGMTCGQVLETGVSPATESCPMGIPWEVEKRCWRWEVWSHRVSKPLFAFFCLLPAFPIILTGVSTAGCIPLPARQKVLGGTQNKKK